MTGRNTSQAMHSRSARSRSRRSSTTSSRWSSPARWTPIWTRWCSGPTWGNPRDRRLAVFPVQADLARQGTRGRACPP